MTLQILLLVLFVYVRQILHMDRIRVKQYMHHMQDIDISLIVSYNVTRQDTDIFLFYRLDKKFLINYYSAIDTPESNDIFKGFRWCFISTFLSYFIFCYFNKRFVLVHDTGTKF